MRATPNSNRKPVLLRADLFTMSSFKSFENKAFKFFFQGPKAEIFLSSFGTLPV